MIKNCSLSLLFISLFLVASAQNDSIQAPYLRFPSYPPFKLLLTDSSEFSKDMLEKKSAVMVMLFSPDCDHCQHETEDLIRNIDKFKKVQIVMASILPLDKTNPFIEKYGLEKYKNIKVGFDKGYFLPAFYNVRNLPFLAFYNRKKELISVFQGSMPMEKVFEELEK